MGYPRIMGAGCAGATSKMFNVNVNQIQFGDKLQGLPPVTGRRRPHKSIRAKEGGNLPDRERIYCINQLGSIGMGNKNSQFAANADGIGPCPNRKNRRGYHGLHIKHHHPTEEHPNRGVSRATEHEDFNTGNMFFGNFMTSQSDNNTGGGTNDGCWDLGGVPTQWACCPEGYEPVGNGSACHKKDDPSDMCSLNDSNPTLNCCGRPEEGSNGTWPLPCTDKRCWDLGGGEWACCPEGYGPSDNGSACQKKDDPSDMCSLNDSNPTLNCCGRPEEDWATWPLPSCTDPPAPPSGIFHAGNGHCSTTYYGPEGNPHQTGSCGGCGNKLDGGYYELSEIIRREVGSDWTLGASTEAMMGPQCAKSLGMGCDGYDGGIPIDGITKKQEREVANAPCGSCWEISHPSRPSINVYIADVCPCGLGAPTIKNPDRCLTGHSAPGTFDNSSWCVARPGLANDAGQLNHFDIWQGDKLGMKDGLERNAEHKSIECPQKLKEIMKTNCCDQYSEGEGCKSICGDTYVCPGGN